MTPDIDDSTERLYRQLGVVAVAVVAVEVVASVIFDVLSTVITAVMVDHPILPPVLKGVEQGFAVGFAEIWLLLALTGDPDLYIHPYGLLTVVVAYAVPVGAILFVREVRVDAA